jgi:outer membrane protein TolC
MKRRVERVVLAVLLGLFGGAGVLAAQGVDTTKTGGRALSLEEALRLAEGTSEQVTIAQAAVQRAEGSVIQARSGYLPQLNSSFSYSRALKSQFQGLSAGGPDTTSTPTCDPFSPDPFLSLEQRVDSIEHRLTLSCPAGGGGGGLGGVDFSELGFGSPNTYNMGLSFSQAIYSGGRLPAQSRAARSGRTTAEIGLTQARAQVRLDVTQAYYDAELAERLLAIAEATLAQAEATLTQAQQQQNAGAGAEFDVLRASVARDNQRPNVIQARSNRDLALLRLKQLLNLPLDSPLRLTTTLSETSAPDTVPLDTAGIVRAPVRQAAEAVTAQEAQLQISKSQMLPSLSLTSQYGRVGYSSTFLPPGWNDFRSNWSVGLAVQFPIFTGGRLHGQNVAAEADLLQSRAQLEQTRELAELDTRNALNQLESSRAALQASSGTVEQAERAYQIAELRYREGISTQLELSDSRLLLQQARVNRAQAARNFEVARMKVALLPDLPISTASGATQGASSGTTQSASSLSGAASAPSGAAQGAGASGQPASGGAGGAGGSQLPPGTPGAPQQ